MSAEDDDEEIIGEEVSDGHGSDSEENFDGNPDSEDEKDPVFGDDDFVEEDIEQEYGDEQSSMVKESGQTLEVHIIPEDERITRGIACANEIARILGTRAHDIDNGSLYIANIDSHDPCLIAHKELCDGKCPLILRRHVRSEPGKKFVEDWPMSKIALPDIDTPYMREAMEHIRNEIKQKHIRKTNAD